MIKNENNINIIKRSQGRESPFLENIKKNNSFTKESQLFIKKINSNHNLDGTTGEESKISFGQKLKINQKRKKNKSKRDKISKLLKNERLKIPKGKRMSIANNCLKSNLNFEKIINALPKKSSSFDRLDTYGNKINKENKKNVHIRFLDTFPSKKLIEIIPIESFKEFNIIETLPDEELISFCSKCCKIY